MQLADVKLLLQQRKHDKLLLPACDGHKATFIHVADHNFPLAAAVALPAGPPLPLVVISGHRELVALGTWCLHRLGLFNSGSTAASLRQRFASWRLPQQGASRLGLWAHSSFTRTPRPALGSTTPPGWLKF